MNETIAKFKEYFSNLGGNDLDLGEIYTDKVRFKDPIHEITGLLNLKTYFDNLNKNLDSGSFVFTNEKQVGNQFFLEWELNIVLKRPKKRVKAQGISVLSLEDKIVYQRDYFDAGELFYENIPLLGQIIRLIKNKIIL